MNRILEIIKSVPGWRGWRILYRIAKSPTVLTYLVSLILPILHRNGITVPGEIVRGALEFLMGIDVTPGAAIMGISTVAGLAGTAMANDRWAEMKKELVDKNNEGNNGE